MQIRVDPCGWIRIKKGIRIWCALAPLIPPPPEPDAFTFCSIPQLHSLHPCAGPSWSSWCSLLACAGKALTFLLPCRLVMLSQRAFWLWCMLLVKYVLHPCKYYSGLGCKKSFLIICSQILFKLTSCVVARCTCRCHCCGEISFPCHTSWFHAYSFHFMLLSLEDSVCFKEQTF